MLERKFKDNSWSWMLSRAELKRVAQPEYVRNVALQGNWQKNEGVFQAPPQAAAVRIEL